MKKKNLLEESIKNYEQNTINNMIERIDNIFIYADTKKKGKNYIILDMAENELYKITIEKIV